MKRRTLTRAALVGATGATLARLATARRQASARVRADLAQRRIRPTPPGDRRLSVVVPAFREDRIGSTVARLRADLAAVDPEQGFEIVVVDDGSGDDTAARAEAAGADVVIRQPCNRGKGAAVRAGMLAASGRAVVMTDADLAYAPDQVLVLLDQLEAGWDIVVGSRRHHDTTETVEASLVRRIGSRVVNQCTRVVLRAQHEDTQCGIKAFRSDVARLVFGHAHVDGFAFDVEIFHLAERYHLSLAEVGVVLENSDRSTVRVARDAVHLLRDLLRIRVLARSGAYDLAPGETDLVPG